MNNSHMNRPLDASLSKLQTRVLKSTLTSVAAVPVAAFDSTLINTASQMHSKNVALLENMKLHPDFPSFAEKNSTRLGFVKAGMTVTGGSITAAKIVAKAQPIVHRIVGGVAERAIIGELMPPGSHSGHSSSYDTTASDAVADALRSRPKQHDW
ncbi:hypothetical protein SAMN02745166_05039 [Prosthecobacter debontii]|uniref:Uncharacterized protein n=1 Tax=Prosthecobacter debontii TaxID=48467 RepID=A0A1T4Z4M0_9BACT|nr:hypothetical protein [Prosthecobacter debontii]SKB08813.1 hypothetical protein SAMN02745166_05039 [Prosthecobacter debontii]